ncbi:MAG: hypothetical protein JWO12_3183, partial [Frankiales bacterium]|nr:hypothetical protein [Frankiales bacterium]
SPTVRTLDRLLAACGVQLRVALEPLKAELDERVAAYTGEVVGLDDSWAAIADGLDDLAPAGMMRAPRRGAVTWAVDGAAALALQGFAAPVEDFVYELVVELDEALRFWMKAVALQGIDDHGYLVMSWLDLDHDAISAALPGARMGYGGLYRLRVVASLGPTVSLAVPWLDRTIRVATVDEVERAHPEHREVLERWRQNRDRDVA